jgi:hypothetical protein
MKILNNTIEIPVNGQKLFLPFHNLWNKNAYHTDQPFSLSPTFIRANSTSGSPVIIGKDFFIGCLNPHADALFKSNGNTLSCTPLEGQQFYYAEGKPYQVWQEYNEYVAGLLPETKLAEVPALTDIEYCTWVEQKQYAAMHFSDHNMPGAVNSMNDRFVDNYIKRINEMSLPRGVLTLDHGWAENSHNFDFNLPYPDKEKFKDFAATIKRIENAGFIPGLWFAPTFLYPDSELFKLCPEIKGELFTGANEGGFQFPLHYFEVTEDTAEIICNWFRKIFTPYIEMGVRKLKIDFTYNNKSKMIKILELLYRTVKEINPTVEVEGHIPDIFASRYQDAVRLNDLIIESNPQWEQLFDDHYEVCVNSAYKTQLNLDHIGTNSPNVSEEDFLKSLNQFKGRTGYPVISLLPDNFSTGTVKTVHKYLWEYQAANTPR